jgi:hypothetical protein
LSIIFWGYKDFNSSLTNRQVNHLEIQYIDVSINNDNLTVQAINSSNCIIHQSVFKEGDDFKFSKGKVTLFTKFALGSEAHVGPRYQKKVFGIDTSGNGKYVSSDSSAGLFFWILPFAGTDIRESRYNKLKKTIEIEYCNSS